MNLKVSKYVWLVAVLLIILGLVGVKFFNQSQVLPSDILKVNGRIEGEHYLPSTQVAGKIMHLTVQEGDVVKKGQILAFLEDAQIKAKVTQAAAAYGVSLANYKAMKTALSVFSDQVPLLIKSAKAKVVHANALLKSAKSHQKQAHLDSLRYQKLFHNKTVDKHQLEMANLDATMARDQVRVAQTAVIQAQQAYTQSKLGYEQIKTKKAQTEAARASTLEAQAGLMEVMSLLDKMKIRAPASGVIMTKLVNEGEVVAPGAVLFDIVNLDQLYLKGYVAENLIGKIRLNQKGALKLDSLPNQTFPVTIRYISSQAEFTPKDVQTQEARVKLVYAIKLYLDHNPQQKITPGIPADAFIKIVSSSSKS